jgi:hypothetical protein
MLHNCFSRTLLQWVYYVSQVRETGNIHRIFVMSRLTIRGGYLEAIKEKGSKNRLKENQFWNPMFTKLSQHCVVCRTSVVVQNLQTLALESQSVGANHHLEDMFEVLKSVRLNFLFYILIVFSLLCITIRYYIQPSTQQIREK